MKICYLDAFSGISGDMTVGALLDAGADSAALLQTLESLGTGAKFQIEKTSRRGIAASKFHVIAGDAKGHRHLKDILELIDEAFDCFADLMTPPKTEQRTATTPRRRR